MIHFQIFIKDNYSTKSDLVVYVEVGRNSDTKMKENKLMCF